MVYFALVIRFQILVRTETEGGPEGPPFYLQTQRSAMAKPFLTYEQQLNKLRNEKKLVVSDDAFALCTLKDIGYFSLIGGYKTPFINPMTRVYEAGTTFEDIYALYRFDTALRELFFKYLCVIESKIRQLISYAFCSIYGEQQSAYLSVTNYNNTPKNAADIQKLLKILNYHANIDTEHPYLVHQRKVYKNVPLWCVMKSLTFGNTSKFYSLLPSNIQSDISKEYKNITEGDLAKYLKLLTLFRNVCAHNERLYSFRIQKDFPDTELHTKLEIPQKGKQYLYGKRDLYGLVIAFRYLLSKDDFLRFKRTLTKIINAYFRESSRISRRDLLEAMGFPNNWEQITRFRI